MDDGWARESWISLSNLMHRRGMRQLSDILYTHPTPTYRRMGSGDSDRSMGHADTDCLVSDHGSRFASDGEPDRL